MSRHPRVWIFYQVTLTSAVIFTLPAIASTKREREQLSVSLARQQTSQLFTATTFNNHGWHGSGHTCWQRRCRLTQVSSAHAHAELSSTNSRGVSRGKRAKQWLFIVIVTLPKQHNVNEVTSFHKTTQKQLLFFKACFWGGCVLMKKLIEFRESTPLSILWTRLVLLQSRVRFVTDSEYRLL